MKYQLSLFVILFLLSACVPSNNGASANVQQAPGVNYVGIATLFVTIIGWVVTAYFQSRILDRQKQAERELKSLDFAQKIALSKREEKYEIFPQTRLKMIEAASMVSSISSGLRSNPDLNSLAPAELEEWVRLLDFTEFQKQELLNSLDKSKYYRETQFLYDANKATRSVDDFHNFLIQNKIFIDDELLTEFDQVLSNLYEISNGIIFGRQSKDPSIEGHFSLKLSMEVFPLMTKIEKMIQQRLNQNFPFGS